MEKENKSIVQYFILKLYKFLLCFFILHFYYYILNFCENMTKILNRGQLHRFNGLTFRLLNLSRDIKKTFQGII